MQPSSLATPSLSEQDLTALRRAKHQLESPALAMKLASVVGAPIEKLLARLPAFANAKVTDATELALRKCLSIALRTLNRRDATSLIAPDKPSNLLHKFAVATTGAAGGAFGLFALPVE
jgi:hypothetical protein